MRPPALGTASCLYCRKLLLVVRHWDGSGQVTLINPGQFARGGPAWRKFFARYGDPRSKAVGAEHYCSQKMTR